MLSDISVKKYKSITLLFHQHFPQQQNNIDTEHNHDNTLLNFSWYSIYQTN